VIQRPRIDSNASNSSAVDRLYRSPDRAWIPTRRGWNGSGGADIATVDD
jgi:hypothetical protein